MRSLWARTSSRVFPGLIDSSLRVPDQVIDEAVQDALHSFVEFQFVGNFRIDLLDFPIEALEERNTFPDFFQR